VLYYSDPESGIAYFEICLGHNPRSCGILPWTKFSDQPYFVHTFQIPDGAAAWLRLKVTNGGMYKSKLYYFILKSTRKKEICCDFFYF
jgi:hypothetical protein